MKSSFLENASKNFKHLTFLSLVFVTLVIVGGAVVRLTNSGAGCGNSWPLCGGEVFITDLRFHKIIEYTHRVTSGLSFVLLFIVYYLSKKMQVIPAIKITAKISFIFICIEALIGAGLVLFGWVGEDSSIARTILIAVHLVNSLLLLSALALLTVISYFPESGIDVDKLKNKIQGELPLLGFFLFTASFGAITALADTLFPSSSLYEGIINDFSSTSHFLLRIRIIHPVLGIGLALWLYNYFSQLEPDTQFKDLKISQVLPHIGIFLIFCQILSGILNVILLTPTFTQLTHLLISLLLWILITSSLCLSFKKQV